MTYERLFGLFRDTIPDLAINALTSYGIAVDERDVQEDVVEIGLGNWRPDGTRHLIDDSFPG